MNKGEMLECLINYYSDGNKSRFAETIGVAPSTLSNWITRNTFDIELIFRHCSNVSAEWLITGEGEMIKSNSQDETFHSQNETHLLDLCRLLVENYQQRDDVMNKLVSMVKGMQ